MWYILSTYSVLSYQLTIILGFFWPNDVIFQNGIIVWVISVVDLSPCYYHTFFCQGSQRIGIFFLHAFPPSNRLLFLLQMCVYNMVIKCSKRFLHNFTDETRHCVERAFNGRKQKTYKKRSIVCKLCMFLKENGMLCHLNSINEISPYLF